MPLSDEDRVVRQMTRNAKALAKANAALAALENERADLYRAARERVDGKPLVTFRDIASIYGVTEAAVMQKAKRAGVAS